jgi:hypothetical protein
MSDIQQANIPASTVTLLASAARTETVTGTAVKGLCSFYYGRSFWRYSLH